HLYSDRAASSRSRAVVSPGMLWDGWMYSFTPREVRISATVVIVIHTTVTNAMVDSGPTRSKWFSTSTDASTAGTHVSITTSASSNTVFPEEWRVGLSRNSAAEPVTTTFIPSSLARKATSMFTLLIPEWEKIQTVSRRSNW